MRSTVRLGVLVIAAALVASPALANATSVKKALHGVGGPGIYGADAEFRTVIESSIDRFDSVGLELPSLRIFVHPGPEGCDTHLGYYGRWGAEDRVDLCTQSEFYVLHELAHAWDQHSLPEPIRQAFLDHAGLEWYDPDLRWVERGAESLANNVAWGLLAKPLERGQARALSELVERFELLTGVQTPRIE